VIRAVVFDFFGTLTDPAVEAKRRLAFDTTAASLGIAADTFAGDERHVSGAHHRCTRLD
jgi:hypothetical protein